MDKDKIEKYLHDFYNLKSNKKHEYNEIQKGECFILMYLYHNQEKEIISKDISDSMQCSTARVAKLLNKLEDKGLIIKGKTDCDNRLTIVKLTDNGIIYAKNIKDNALNKIMKVVEIVGDEDFKVFLKVLKVVHQVNKEENYD